MKGIREISEETGIPERSVKKYLQIETNLTNYGAKSANLHSLSTNSPNYENWTWNKI